MLGRGLLTPTEFALASPGEIRRLIDGDRERREATLEQTAWTIVNTVNGARRRRGLGMEDLLGAGYAKKVVAQKIAEFKRDKRRAKLARGESPDST